VQRDDQARRSRAWPSPLCAGRAVGVAALVREPRSVTHKLAVLVCACRCSCPVREARRCRNGHWDNNGKVFFCNQTEVASSLLEECGRTGSQPVVVARAMTA
jgi:hypothetical protein